MDTHAEHEHEPDDEPTDPREFWQQRYGSSERIWSGRPNVALVDCISGLNETAPGRALDLGCGEGADTIWLAEQGWQVVAVDIAENAVARGRAAAAARKIPDSQIEWFVADLESWQPPGEFDLVSSCFLHSPVALARAAVLKRAAGVVATGGRLLIVGHAETPPWASHQHADRGLRNPDQQLDDLELAPEFWTVEIAETRERAVQSPSGESTTLSDSVLLLRHS